MLGGGGKTEKKPHTGASPPPPPARSKTPIAPQPRVTQKKKQQKVAWQGEGKKVKNPQRTKKTENFQ